MANLRAKMLDLVARAERRARVEHARKAAGPVDWQEPPASKPRLRCYAGERITEQQLLKVITAHKAKVAKYWADKDEAAKQARAIKLTAMWEVTAPAKSYIHGGTCPNCSGSGVYRWHLSGQSGKCFHCNGKGYLNQRDLAFNASRQKTGEVSLFRSA